MKKKIKDFKNSLIHKNLANIIKTNASDPRFKYVTLSSIETSSDLSFAKILVTVFPKENHKEILYSLNKASGFLSKQLGRRLKTRNTPKLSFTYDNGYDYTDQIEKLIIQNKKNIH